MLQMKYNPERVCGGSTLLRERQDNNGYNAPFPLWWTMYDLQGWGYLIGEQHPQGEWINRKLQNEMPKVKYAQSVDVQQADILLDISVSPLPGMVNFIFCMAVLETRPRPSICDTSHGFCFVAWWSALYISPRFRF